MVKDGKLTAENKVKIYQKSDADYFYDFLSLSRPLNTEKYFDENYTSVSSLEEFDMLINPNDKKYIKYSSEKDIIKNKV